MNRLRCQGCGLLQTQCVCAYIVPLNNRTPVCILQHPDERHHALNTARWVAAGLRQVRVVCQAHFSPSDWCVPGHTPMLLYPADQADEHQHPPQDTEASVSVSLVVIDGTWRQAAAIVREHPALRALPRLALSTSSRSAYRLRKSPRSDGLSTVEAVAAALDMVDAPTSHASLIRPFQVQIDRQIALQRRLMGEPAFARNYPDLATPVENKDETQ